ncbi:hypothetical protein HPP92_013447 [Vanilla planifolia]|uniref:Trichome birefringence-like N-terminal domain-containing protein n=1 Tax=Vanilla planifolia TaxID=51239 RepID=A0A835UYN0_VANPL|nr:hypothetical protein HPP92_013447 [Vanilla planifolia]
MLFAISLNLPRVTMDIWKPLFVDHFLAGISTKWRVLSSFALGIASSLFLVSLLASINGQGTAPSSSASIFSWLLHASGRFPLGIPNDSNFASHVGGNSSSLSLAYISDFNSSITSNGELSSSEKANGSLHGLAFESNVFDSDAVSESTHHWNRDNSTSSGVLEVKKPLFQNNRASKLPIEAEESITGNFTSRDKYATESQNVTVDIMLDKRNRLGVGQDNVTNLINYDSLGKNESRESKAGKSMQKPLSNDSHVHSFATKEIGAVNKKCDLFDGKWVRDSTKPYYPQGSCPFIDIDFDCYKNGRPDDEFLRWRWQPNGCNIPRLNATDFLVRLMGKRIVFVGDSLNRNMWESLVCILQQSIKNKSRVYEVSGRKQFKMPGYYSFHFKDYNCSVDFVRSPFLVKELSLKNVNGSEDERLRLDLLDETKSAYHQADIVVFNTGHWWTHEKTSSGIDYYQVGNHVYPVLAVMEAYKKALTTWARWVDGNIDSRKTKVVFRGYSLTHFRGGQWNSGGQCHNETEPIYNDNFLTKYPLKMTALEGVLQQMKTPVLYLNISRLTDYRKDGHPSIYRTNYKEHSATEKTQDCSHWCLPGIPDTWNELLYVSLVTDDKESRT